MKFFFYSFLFVFIQKNSNCQSQRESDYFTKKSTAYYIPAFHFHYLQTTPEKFNELLINKNYESFRDNQGAFGLTFPAKLGTNYRAELQLAGLSTESNLPKNKNTVTGSGGYMAVLAGYSLRKNEFYQLYNLVGHFGIFGYQNNYNGCDKKTNKKLDTWRMFQSGLVVNVRAESYLPGRMGFASILNFGIDVSKRITLINIASSSILHTKNIDQFGFSFYMHIGLPVYGTESITNSKN
jgi:hypothetical protein